MPRTLDQRTFILLALLWLRIAPAYASATSDSLAILEDPSGQLTANQITNTQLATRWQSHPINFVPNFGVSHSAFWIRYPVQTPPQDTTRHFLVIASSVIDSVQIFVDRAGTLEATPPQGDRVKFLSRPVANRQFALSWKHEPGKPVRAFWIRIASFDGLHESVPLHIYSAAEFQQHTSRDDFMYGIYFGVIAFLVTFSLLIFIFMRDYAQLLFAGYGLSFGFWNLIYQGFADEFLWAGRAISNQLLMVATLAFTLCLTFFTCSFLNLRKQVPWLARILRYLALATTCVAMPLILLDHYCVFFLWLMSIVVISLTLMLLAGVLSSLRGSKEGWFYLGSWTLVIGGAMLYMGKVMNLFPANALTENTFQIGTIFQALVLSIGVALRMLVSQKQLNQSLESLVHERTQELEVANLRLQELSSIDTLTGLPNRRIFFERLNLAVDTQSRQHQPISIIMIDVDFFKQFNDSYGHLKGDQCLMLVAGKIRECLPRKGNFCARYGGEEFILCLPNTDTHEAAIVAERVRKGVCELAIAHQGSSVAEFVTISVGIGTCLDVQADIQMPLLQKADEALYEAKHRGRNQVYVAS